MAYILSKIRRFKFIEIFTSFTSITKINHGDARESQSEMGKEVGNEERRKKKK